MVLLDDAPDKIAGERTTSRGSYAVVRRGWEGRKLMPMSREVSRTSRKLALVGRLRGSGVGPSEYVQILLVS